jgi:uncharacterized protein
LNWQSIGAVSERERIVANRLQYETSPYLLQHKDNPVDWYAWGEEALAAAKEQDKPILLSIGYSACHWCHVMEHESFSSERIARIMNQHFINIKVDREERPDLDNIYMAAVQMLTGHGGWPMTVFLTPEGKPFYGGTYFPPEDRPPMPGFPRVLMAIAEAYRERRHEVEDSAGKIQGHLADHFQHDLKPGSLNASMLDAAVRNLAPQFDSRNGGFGGAPKFPPAMAVEFLLRAYRRSGATRALEMAEFTLTKMARGGIFDQVGGGFHRYTVDDIWLVPHFEKMLYDNALLLRAYVDAYRLTGKPLYRQIAERTFDYVLREMVSPEGGFYSTQDADSEGEEGKFYVWAPDEIDAVLDAEDAEIVKRYYGVTEHGNFEGKNIPHVPEEPERVATGLGLAIDDLMSAIDRANAKLYEARAERVWPGRDEKVLTSWNGLMLRAFAEGAVALGRSDLLETASRNATFLRENVYDDGKLLRTYKDGQAKLNGFLEDYAYLIDGLVSLYEATFDVEWVRWADALTRTMIEEFHDDESGGFFDTGVSHEALITRPKEVLDNAVPSGNSVAADALQRLAILTGNVDYRRLAVEILERYGSIATAQPNAFGRLLSAYEFAIAHPQEIALVGSTDDERLHALLDVVHRAYLPNKVVALLRPGDDAGVTETVPLLAYRDLVDGKPAAYVCYNYACRQPVTEPEALAAELGLAGDATV